MDIYLKNRLVESLLLLENRILQLILYNRENKLFLINLCQSENFNKIQNWIFINKNKRIKLNEIIYKIKFKKLSKNLIKLKKLIKKMKIKKIKNYIKIK